MDLQKGESVGKWEKGGMSTETREEKERSGIFDPKGE